MKIKTQLLAISFFLDKRHWKNFIKKGLSAFIKNEGAMIMSYIIEFNSESGKNIRFTIESSKTNALAISEKVDLFFQEHLNKNSYKVFLKKFSIGNGFMDFPQNTIQYGLYYPNDYRKGVFIKDDFKFIIYNSLSNVVFSYFQSRNYNDTNVILLSYHLFCTVVSGIFEYESKYYDEELIGLIDYLALSVNQSSIDSDLVEEAYNDNKLLLSEIFTKVVSEKKMIFLGLKEFNNTVLFVTSKCNSELPNNVKQTLYEIFEIIFKILNLNNQNLYMALYFTQKHLKNNESKE